jgi:hypothetical protein
MAKQGRVLETMAVNELDLRRKRLEEYQIKARFALAESYDRATKAQLDAEITKQAEAGAPEDKTQDTGDDKKQNDMKHEVTPETTTEEPSDEKDEGSTSSFKQKLLKR